MPWTDSAVFREWVAASLEPRANFTGKWRTAPPPVSAFKVALFGTAATPDRSALVAATAYGNGTWTPANQAGQIDAAYWPAAGVDLAGVAYANGPGAQIMFDAADTAGLTASGTLTGVFGSLLYLDDAANVPPQQGAAYHYFGSPAGHSVTAGTFTIIWNDDGLMLVTF